MHDISVLSEKRGYEAAVVYDLNVIVLIHYADRFKRRVGWFKQLGLINLRIHRVHVTVLASAGDGAYLDEIMHGWEKVSVSFIEMASAQPIPKINGFYLWLAQSDLKARWHLRVDDDSVSDVNGLLNHAEQRYHNIPIHLMASPGSIEIGPPIFGDFLAKNGIPIPSMLHEYEASLTSAAAFEVVFSNKRAMTFLEDTGRSFAGPGDRALAFAMHLSNSPTAACPVMTKDFNRNDMAIYGGNLSHIHYVDWDNVPFTGMLTALVHGHRRKLVEEDIEKIVGKTMNFGRGIGFHITTLVLLPSGAIRGGSNANETYWARDLGNISFSRPDGFLTSIFTSVIEFENAEWYYGPHLETDVMHYLTLCKHA